jgi:hypothetical protein
MTPGKHTATPAYKVLGHNTTTEVSNFAVVGREGETHIAYFAGEGIANDFVKAVNEREQLLEALKWAKDWFEQIAQDKSTAYGKVCDAIAAAKEQTA